MTSEAGFPWEAPTEHGKHWIEVEVSYPADPSKHEGAGAITWGANLDRLSPLGEEAVSIIKEAWERREHPHDPAKRDQKESQPIGRAPSSDATIKPGWPEHIDPLQYWVHLTLNAPVNERWVEESGENWLGGQLIDDGIVKRSVTVEATTSLGRRALRIMEALHSAHPRYESGPPKGGERTRPRPELASAGTPKGPGMPAWGKMRFVDYPHANIAINRIQGRIRLELTVHSPGAKLGPESSVGTCFADATTRLSLTVEEARALAAALEEEAAREAEAAGPEFNS
jgi:hypothetical protein